MGTQPPPHKTFDTETTRILESRERATTYLPSPSTPQLVLLAVPLFLSVFAISAMDAFFRSLMKGSSLVTKDAAIKGRSTAVRVAETHYVLKGNKMSAPFPDPMRVAVFATGCFWGTEKGFWRLPGVYATAVVS